MDDLISRQDAIKNAHFPMIDDAGYEVVRVDDILALPSAEQKNNCIVQIRINRDDMEDLVNEKVNEIVDKMVEPKMGKWVDIDNYYRMATCSYCHKVTMFEKWGKYTKPYNYCPNCGADMRGGESGCPMGLNQNDDEDEDWAIARGVALEHTRGGGDE